MRKKQPRQTLVFSDRYSATGTPRPDPKTVCKGKCEGMGFYPDMTRARKEKLAHEDVPFVTCERCRGTGKEPV